MRVRWPHTACATGWYGPDARSSSASAIPASTATCTPLAPRRRTASSMEAGAPLAAKSAELACRINPRQSVGSRSRTRTSAGRSLSGSAMTRSASCAASGGCRTVMSRSTASFTSSRSACPRTAPWSGWRSRSPSVVRATAERHSSTSSATCGSSTSPSPAVRAGTSRTGAGAPARVPSSFLNMGRSFGWFAGAAAGARRPRGPACTSTPAARGSVDACRAGVKTTTTA